MSMGSDDIASMINARFNDMATRFDDTNERIESVQHSLDGLESKEHAASEIQHLTYRITLVEDSIEKSKSTMWRTASTISSIIAFVVTTVISLMNNNLF